MKGLVSPGHVSDAFRGSCVLSLNKNVVVDCTSIVTVDLSVKSEPDSAAVLYKI